MSLAEHPSSQSVEEFVTGRLADAEAEAIIAHLADCDACLAGADRLWAGLIIPDLGLERSRRVERRLRRRIRRTDLGGQAIRLGTNGLWSVFLAFLRPLFGKR